MGLAWFFGDLVVEKVEEVDSLVEEVETFAYGSLG